MAKAISVHIGVNHVRRTAYGSGRALTGCVRDAREMAQVAAQAGIEQRVLLENEDATARAVVAAIEHAAAELDPRGLFLISFAGHGDSLIDVDGDEIDNRDETWRLYDRELSDDCLRCLWGRFADGTRVVVVSDSCNSGTVIRHDHEGRQAPPSPRGRVMRGGPAGGGDEGMRGARAAGRTSEPAARNGGLARRGPSPGVHQARDGGRTPELPVAVLLLSACQDGEAAQGFDQGVFTRNLVAVWNRGRFEGTYLDFHAAIAMQAGSCPRPGYTLLGKDFHALQMQKPFTVDPPPL
jgi:hypothetical protein